ncbi:hypothetical protein GLW07_19040 [Bacillus hwajinpoensis]|uniref:DUF3221 domain-containing protein n=1 Tax=Guptibacillus hwajinpoensis TaxID=208199 RepID=A0A845F3S9_9BACL|nr:hypothetical protein [Pseudalkalibacillus hwajinpoensis]MYL65459.1 hypothetical protein [Pseudalkalibacillus hwajinpoensis]
MFKSKITFIMATLAITLIGCFQVEEATFIEGEITKINNESGEMEIKVESWSTISDAESSSTPYIFEEMPDSHTIRVSNPDQYDEGKEVQVKVIKNYEEDVWDLNRLKFEVEKAT